MHIFFTKEGAFLVDWKFIKIYEEGLRQGIFHFDPFPRSCFDDIGTNIDDISNINYGWVRRLLESLQTIQVTCARAGTHDVDIASIHTYTYG